MSKFIPSFPEIVRTVIVTLIASWVIDQAKRRMDS
jgi:hypothetical protein